MVFRYAHYPNRARRPSQFAQRRTRLAPAAHHGERRESPGRSACRVGLPARRGCCLVSPLRCAEPRCAGANIGQGLPINAGSFDRWRRRRVGACGGGAGRPFSAKHGGARSGVSPGSARFFGDGGGARLGCRDRGAPSRGGRRSAVASVRNRQSSGGAPFGRLSIRGLGSPQSATGLRVGGRYRRDRRAVDRKRGCRDRGSWRLHVLSAAPSLAAIDGAQKERADRSPPFPIS